MNVSPQLSFSGRNPVWWIATGLLMIMILIFVGASVAEHDYPWLVAVRAFSEAAMVGALADWFAVTALFHHPLGVPIPHTAIIPNNKARIGRNLGHFIETNFVSDEVLGAQSFNIAGAVTSWLEVERNRSSVANRIGALVPQFLETLDDREIRAFLNDQISNTVRQINLSHTLGRILVLFTANGLHEVLLDEVVKQSKHFFLVNQDWIREQVRDASPWFVPEFVDRKIFEAIVARTEQTLGDALTNRDHELRKRVHDAVRQFIEKLEHSEEFKQRGEEIKTLLLENEVFREYVGNLKNSILSALKEDAQKRDSRIRSLVMHALTVFTTTVSGSPEIQNRVNRFVRALLRTALGARQGRVAEMIASIIESWDSRTLVGKLEEQVGRDLQYIRINGTLVGGLVGLGIYAVERLFN